MFGWCGMKKFFKDNLVVIIIILAFVIGIIGGVLFVLNNMKKSQEKIEKLVEQVDQKYKSFSEDSTVVSERRTKIYTEVFNNVYYVDFSAKSESWKENFNEYYALVDKFSSDYKEVMNTCNNYNFIYDSTKQKCESILKYYEIIINNFVTDYKLYNDNITKYNEWTDTNTSYSKLELFTPEKYLEYVDYNNNGEVEHY